ncbi:hypothetical protein [Streptomyces sp. BH055]|uniref:hypothetical protein n=1 Tax=Streptomyces sp. BH055 TaxID=3401173 RepID=UPI003BB6C7C6
MRPVEEQVTITAADMLRTPSNAQNARTATITSFTAPRALIPNWQDHLARWAVNRSATDRPLDVCIVDLKAPELEADSLVDLEGLAQITAVSADAMPDAREEGAARLPEPQEGEGAGMRWSLPVARDWAESYTASTVLEPFCRRPPRTRPHSPSVSSTATTRCAPLSWTASPSTAARHGASPT